ncbi:MAG: hypothetical protein V1855_00935, partial [bacterium]
MKKKLLLISIFIFTTIFHTTAQDAEVLWYKIATLNGHNNIVLSVAWHPTDKKLLASSSWDETIKIWNIYKKTDKQCIATLKEHTDRVYSVAWHPKIPSLLASASWDKTIKIWDLYNEPGKQ